MRAYRALNPPKSPKGRPVPVPRDPAAFLANVGPADERGCREWQGTRYSGVGRYGLWQEAGVAYGAHRVAKALANGEPTPPGVWTLHHCDNPPCCEPSHLYLGGHAENTRDRVEHGRQQRGTDHHATSLTDEQVIEARATYAAGAASVTATAARLGMALSPCHAMLRGRTWAHLPGAVESAPVDWQVRGESVARARLTSEQVVEARRRWATGEWTLSRLAAEYGVERGGVGQMLRGETWAHLPGAVPSGTIPNLGPRGELAGNTSLTAEKVRAMRARFTAGERAAALAAEYGIGGAQFYRIVRRERWAHVD